MTKTRAVLLLGVVLFLFNIWGYDLWAPDEPFFGEGAREMIVDGHWLVSHINGQLNTHKPPLFFWLIAIFSLPFGRVLSLTARLPSVLAALGTLALALRLGRRYGGERTATLAGVVLATTYLFWDKARSAQIDSLLCCLIWVALSAFEAYRAGEARGRGAGILFWAAAALAVLAKGPVGLLLPLGIALLTLAFDRRVGQWRGFAPISGVLVFALICGAWIVATKLWGPPEYSVWGALKEHFLDRGIYGMHHPRPWWYYAKVLPGPLMPWTLLIPGALVVAFRRRDRVDRFLLVAAIFVVLFFSVSTEKRTLYVLPALPAIALLVARFVGTVLGWETGPSISRRWLTVAQGLLGGLMVLVGLAMVVGARRVEQFPVWVLWSLAVFPLVGGVVTLFALARGRLLTLVLAPAATCAAAYLFVAAIVFPMSDPFKSEREFTKTLVAVTAPSRAAGHAVVAFDLRNMPVAFAFYSNGLYTVETEQSADLARHLANHARVFAVVNVDRLDELPTEIREPIEFIATTQSSRRKAALIANHPAPPADANGDVSPSRDSGTFP